MKRGFCASEFYASMPKAVQLQVFSSWSSCSGVQSHALLQFPYLHMTFKIICNVVSSASKITTDFGRTAQESWARKHSSSKEGKESSEAVIIYLQLKSVLSLNRKLLVPLIWQNWGELGKHKKLQQHYLYYEESAAAITLRSEYFKVLLCLWYSDFDHLISHTLVTAFFQFQNQNVCMQLPRAAQTLNDRYTAFPRTK